jgi:L-asparaginase II
MEPTILAAVVRGETTESLHRGHIVILDGNGSQVSAAGDPETVTYFRSASKPFQTMPLITTGAADAFGFTESEIAMACASHSGQRRHVELVEGMLSKTGLSETDLRCGSHLPFYHPEAEKLIRDNKTPTQLHNNCSGKHAAMLATAKHIGADITTYEKLEHPVQQMILDAVAEFTEVPREAIRVGTDGCAAPNFAVPISAMARSFLNLISANSGKAAKRIATAMIDHPELIGGTDRLDTILMQAAPGQILSKVGADGVWLCAVLPNKRFPMGLGIAVKIEDGDDFLSRPVVAVEILRQLGILEKEQLPDLSPLPIKNRRGDIVGSVRSAYNLH